jgi:polysaccharide pyruvyl transferase WcaK-like protein
MKIGIITFHWAANYGGVLQAYALQKYLSDCGHDVEILDYKPSLYDYSPLKYLIRPQLLLHFRSEFNLYRKELRLREFREKYLKLSKRYKKLSQLKNATLGYDVLISGSDQVLNPSFLLRGEIRPTTAYFLDFGDAPNKIGYAVSFGCTQYPENASSLARKAVANFTKIGVRENSGIDILKDLNYKGNVIVVPDPTILIGKRLFQDIHLIKPQKEDYYCMYILRKEIKCSLNNVLYMDETHCPLTMEEWIGTIAFSKGLITNSYHGMIMAILHHVPFVSIMEVNKGSGMNDRFLTLLSKLELEKQIVNEGDDYASVLNQNIDWAVVDMKIEEFRSYGRNFLSFNY